MKTLSILILGCLLSACCMAQSPSSTVKILDLSVYPAIELDTITGTPLDTGSISFNLDFKISNVSEAASVKIQAGTSQGSGDILDVTSGIIYQNGQYYIHHDGINTPVNSHSAGIRLRLTRPQEAACNFITLFMVDNQGNETNKLYFTR